MEFPVPLKVEEDPEVFIDLDTEGNSPEDIVIEWHLEIRRLFARDVEANGDMKLISVMKDYITAIAERAIHFENIEKLETVVDKHIEHIYWLYTDWNLNMCFTEVYLQQMEHIMTFYVNLTLRILLGMKEKKKVTPKDVAYNAQKIINRLSSFLLQNEYHIFHVLIRQCTTAVDDMVKDVLNILNSNICKHLFKSLYMYFLFYAPVSDLSDEAFCRVYILFENWKAFEENIQKEQMELCLRNIFRRGTECIDGNEFLMKILRPQSSLMSELMKVVACDPLITKAYFDYIKSKDKSDTDDLDDISRLDLDDQRASDSEEAENDYNTRYTQLLKKMAKNDKELPVDISSEVKEEILVRSESPFIQNEIEVTISDSDSDSDLEIVSIIPSRNWSSQPISDDAENVYPGRKENPPTRKKPSFLESICIDVDNNRRPISRKQESGKSNGAQAIKSFDASKPCNRSQIINRNNKEPSKLGIVENVFHEKSLIVNSERLQTKAKASLESSRRKPIESQSSFLKDKQWRSKSREGESVEVGNSWHSQVQIESLEVNTAWPSRTNANETSCKSPQIETIEVSDSTQVVSLEADKSYNKINSSEQSQTQKKSCEPCPAAAIPNQSSAVSPQIASSEVDTSLHPTTQRNEIEQNETLEVNSEKNVPLQKDLMDVDDSLHKQTQENKSVEPSSEFNTSCQTKPKTNNPFETWRSQTKLNGWRSLEFNNTRSRLSGIEIFPSRKELKESCSSEREGMKNTSGTSPTRKTDSSQQDSEESATSYSSQGKISETSETSKIKNNETPCESSQIDSMEIDISVSQVKAGEMLHKFRQLYPPQRKRTDVLPTSRIIESDSDAQINEIGTTTIETCTTSEISELQSDQTNGIDDLTSKKPQMKTNERMTVSKTNEVMALSQLMSPEPSNLPDTENPSSSELEIREVASQPSCRQNQLESLNEEKDHSPPQTPQSDNDLDREILALDNLHLFENEKQDTSSVEKLRDVEVMPNNPQIKVNTVFNINKTVEETESTVEKSPIRNGYLTTKISSDKLGSGKLVKTNGSFKTIRENEKNPETTKKIELSNENEDERYPREETLCSKCSRENNLISDKSPNSEIIKRQQNTQNKFRSNGQLKKFVIDTGQGLPPQPVDTGQLQHFASTSADMKTPSEENFAAKTSMIKSGIVNCSEDQVMVAGDAETCQFGFPTPPGSEEDNDEQTNPVYSGILRTELGESSTCSASHTNSDSNLLQTVDEITLSALNGPLVQTLSVVPETIHSEIVINERTCHGEEKISERRCSNTDLGKYYEQFVKDAVGSQNSDDEEYSEPDHQAQTSSKAPPSDSEDIFEDMSQFLKCCDVTQSSTSPHRRRKGMVKVANESISSSERSPSRTKKRVTINDRPSFDDFEDELWDRPKSNKETDSPEPRLDEVATDPDEAETRRPSRRKSITKEKPSELPLSKYRTRRNGSNTNIPLSGSPPEQPRLKGILKKVEQKHSYHPLHPVDDEIDHTFIFIPYQPRSGKGKRGLVGSGMVKVFRKSFTAYKVSTNDFKLRLYPVVSIERLSPNTLLVWERVTRRSRGYICEEVPSTQPDKPMYKIVFDKSTLQLNSNDKKYYCDPSVSDDSSAFTQSKNPYQKTENEAESSYTKSRSSHSPAVAVDVPSDSGGRRGRGRKRGNASVNTTPETPKRRKDCLKNSDSTDRNWFNFEAAYHASITEASISENRNNLDLENFNEQTISSRASNQMSCDSVVPRELSLRVICHSTRLRRRPEYLNDYT
ncbi:hypothetical protein HHI36_018853 [Cryptolaemus montrouzieri]|uniref:Uncharacterized protein n=1 Tax=Cryptolaemus montrouzieri TaxID=559131 RepID=A0ABD2P190_9CUCU